MVDFSFFDCSGPFHFFNWISLQYLIKWYLIMFINFEFWLGSDRPPGLIFFVPALLLSILTPFFLPSSSVSFSYFILAVPMRECLRKHSCMSSPTSCSHTEWYTFLFRETTWSKWSKYRLSKTYYNNNDYLMLYCRQTDLGVFVQ